MFYYKNETTGEITAGIAVSKTISDFTAQLRNLGIGNEIFIKLCNATNWFRNDGRVEIENVTAKFNLKEQQITLYVYAKE